MHKVGEFIALVDSAVALKPAKQVPRVVQKGGQLDVPEGH
jgi:hypothetical protein